MTIKELRYIAEVLQRIKNKDEHIEKAIAFVNKDLAMFAARKGQLKEQYESDPFVGF